MKLLFKILQLVEETIVFRIRDLGLVFDVVEAVMPVQLRPQVLNPGPRLARRAHTASRGTLMRTGAVRAGFPARFQPRPGGSRSTPPRRRWPPARARRGCCRCRRPDVLRDGARPPPWRRSCAR